MKENKIQVDSTEITSLKNNLPALLSRCCKCNLRTPYYDSESRQYRKWCRPCALKWQRDNHGHREPGAIRDMSPDWEVEIPERYRAAETDDLSKKLVDVFLTLSDDVGLYLWGEPGRGKTYSMAAFAKYLWRQGWDIRRISYETLMLRIRDTFKPGATETELSIIKPFLNTGKLFVEDVGTVVSIGSQESDFSLRTFLNILDSRLENCLATYITSNKSVDEIKKSFDARIASRIQQACEIIEVKGRDKRQCL